MILSRTSGSGSRDIEVILVLTVIFDYYNIILQEYLAGYALHIMIQGRAFTNMARAELKMNVVPDMETWLDLRAAI